MCENNRSLARYENCIGSILWFAEIKGISLFAPRESSLHHTRLLLPLPSPLSTFPIIAPLRRRRFYLLLHRQPPQFPPEKVRTCRRFRRFSFKALLHLSFLLIHPSPLAAAKFPLNSPSHVARRRLPWLLWTGMWIRGLPREPKFASVCLAKAEWLLTLSIFSRYTNSFVDLLYKLQWNAEFYFLLVNYRTVSYQLSRWIHDNTLQKFHRSLAFLLFQQC